MDGRVDACCNGWIKDWEDGSRDRLMDGLLVGRMNGLKRCDTSFHFKASASRGTVTGELSLTD